MQSLTNHNQNAATKSSTLQQQQQKIQIHVHHILRLPSRSSKNWNLRQVPKQTSSFQDPVLSLKGLRPATGLTNSRITHHQNATHNKILSPPLPLTQKSFNLSAATIWNPQLLVRTEVGYPELAVVQFAAQLIVGLDLAARRGLQNRELRPVRGGNDGVKTVIDCEVILLFSFFALCRHTTGCLVAGMWTMRSLRSSASRIICLWKGKRRCWRRWRALDIRLGKWKRREERCGTDAKYVCEIWTSTIFFFNYSKTIIIIRPPLYHHIFKTDLIHPSLSQHACLLKAVTLIAVIVNFAKITIMSPLLFLQRVTFDCHKMTLL